MTGLSRLQSNLATKAQRRPDEVLLFECQVPPSGNAAGYPAWGPKGCRWTLLHGDSLIDARLNLPSAVES